MIITVASLNQARGRTLQRALKGEPVPVYRIPRHRGCQSTAVSHVEDASPVRPAADLPAPAGLGVVTGAVRYTTDIAPDRLLHMNFSVATFACAHPRDRTDQGNGRSRRACCLYLRGCPRRLFSSARHEISGDDPDDTRVLTMCFASSASVCGGGCRQRSGAEEGCAQIEVDYEPLPAVFDPERPCVRGASGHSPDKGIGVADSRSAPQSCRRSALAAWRCGGGLRRADVVYEGTLSRNVSSNAPLETHAAITAR